MKTESHERDPTWMQSLPNEALRCFMKHALDVVQGLYQPEIRGALTGTTADKYNVAKFHKATRVNQRFATSFLIAYDSLIGQPAAASADAAAGPDGHGDAAESAEESQAEKTTQSTDASTFRRQCEQHCVLELEARSVLLVAGGTHAENKLNVTTTRLYHNWTESSNPLSWVLRREERQVVPYLLWRRRYTFHTVFNVVSETCMSNAPF